MKRTSKEKSFLKKRPFSPWWPLKFLKEKLADREKSELPQKDLGQL
jgi:hypothetical protein